MLYLFIGSLHNKFFNTSINVLSYFIFGNVTSSFNILSSISFTVLPSKGAFPNLSTYNVTPRLQRSDANPL